MTAAIPFYDLGALNQLLKGELLEAAARVIDTNRLILGPEVEAFERDFAALCGAAHAIGVANGLDALRLTLQGLGIGPGDEVIVPAHTFVATWLAVSDVGATPVPCEPAAGSYNIAAEDAERLITPRSRAILPVHLYGIPAPMAELADLCRRHKLALIEDAAQAHGATLDGAPCGSFGHAACFSFYPAKNLGALGDGGAIVTSDDALAARLRLLRNYGSREKYQVEEAGWNSRLDEIQAAMLRVKLARLDQWNDSRRALVERYRMALADVPGLVLPDVPKGADPCWHLFVVQTRARDALRAHLAGQGIETGIHYPIPVYRMPPYRSLAPAGEGEADRLATTVLSLPLWPMMPESHVERVAAAMREFLARQ